eukprot:2296529-Heterocapsa_arctica.AAC.1
MVCATWAAATVFPLLRSLVISLYLRTLIAQAFALPCSSPRTSVVLGGSGSLLTSFETFPLPRYGSLSRLLSGIWA